MNRIDIKHIDGRVLFSYESENNTVSITLGKAIESGANLRGANLRGADLSGADLRGADLSGANLRGAPTTNRYVAVYGIGSANRQTLYCVEEDKVWCGCFTGTMAEFEAQIKSTHANNEQHLSDYMAAIQFLKSIKPRS